MSKDDIDRMVRDAEAHEAEDKARREEAEVRNQADSLVYQTEKLLKDQAESLEGNEKDDVERELAAVKAALEGSDIEAIKSATEKLVTVSQTFGQRLYEEAAKNQEAAGGSESTADDDNIVDEQ